MRAPLADQDTPDRGAAGGAGLAGTLIDPEVILEPAAAIDPVDAGAVVSQAGAQGGPDPPPEPSDFLVVQLVTAP